MKPNRTRQIHFRLSEQLYALIEGVAIDEETSLATVARRLLRDHFESVDVDRLGPVAAQRYQELTGAATGTASAAA